MSLVVKSFGCYVVTSCLWSVRFSALLLVSIDMVPLRIDMCEYIALMGIAFEFVGFEVPLGPPVT